MNKWQALEKVQKIKEEIDGMKAFKGRSELLSSVKNSMRRLQLYRFDGEERIVSLMVKDAERVLDVARHAHNEKYKATA